jgi:hypothetical protein
MLLVVLDVVAAVGASGVGNRKREKGRKRVPTSRLCSVKQQRKAADMSKTRTPESMTGEVRITLSRPPRNLNGGCAETAQHASHSYLIFHLVFPSPLLLYFIPGTFFHFATQIIHAWATR